MSATGVVTGGGVVSATVHDTRRTFVIHHTGFFLDDHAGAVREVDASNVGPSLAQGHLVSAAWLVRRGKAGNAFLVYNHTTRLIYTEKTQVGQRNAKRGLVRMVMPLPTWLQGLFFLSIVGIPVMVVVGLGVQWKVSRFGKRGAQPLTALLQRRAAEMSAARAAAASTAAPAAEPSATMLDVASRLKELASLHQSGSLTLDEFQAAKAKLLATS